MKSNPPEDMTRGAITFLDVVGWVGIYKRQKNAILDLLDLIGDLQLSANKLTSRAISTMPPYNYQRGLKIETLVKSISDTIVFLTPLEAEISLRIHGELSKQAISFSLQRGIPIRGATSFGDYNYKENIMIGPAVDEAAAWHEYIEWFI